MAGNKRSCQDHGGDPNAPEHERQNRDDSGPATMSPPAKRTRLRAVPSQGGSCPTTSSATSGRPLVALSAADYLSSLSDELLIRILAYLSLPCLLSLAPVSRRLHRLTDDSQLWKAIYYDRFVLPRVMRIPGFRGGALPSTTQATTTPLAPAALSLRRGKVLNWKQQYKLRHNWAQGKCAVEELRLGGDWHSKNSLDLLTYYNQDEDSNEDCGDQEHSMIVKVVDGIAVTADGKRGLRVWELKSRSLVAAESLLRKTKLDAAGTEASSDTADEQRIHDGGAESNSTNDLPLTPTSLAVDATASGLDIAVGLLNGGFDIWQFDPLHKKLTRRFSHPASSNGSLTAIYYSHPYVLTATDSVLVSLYVFEAGRKPMPRAKPGPPNTSSASLTNLLNPPHLLTSLRSHTSRPPLALSIRKLATVVVASIAYTFSTRQGWSIGIQDLHVKVASTGASALPTVVTTRLAFSPPVNSSRQRRSNGNSTRRDQSAPFSSSLRSRIYAPEPESPADPPFVSSHATPRHRQPGDYEETNGPTTLCYSHPYLLASMPDNTLVLHLCTSNASSLAISPGIRLWGHTSGISDAEITARGKAVSVSMRGEEMRVWELEGRPAAERGRSVAIRPNAGESNITSDSASRENGCHPDGQDYNWDERRNWVGFDDEMVIVLKESRRGQESLMVYDFT